MKNTENYNKYAAYFEDIENLEISSFVKEMVTILRKTTTPDTIENEIFNILPLCLEKCIKQGELKDREWIKIGLISRVFDFLLKRHDLILSDLEPDKVYRSILNTYDLGKINFNDSTKAAEIAIYQLRYKRMDWLDPVIFEKELDKVLADFEDFPTEDPILD